MAYSIKIGSLLRVLWGRVDSISHPHPSHLDRFICVSKVIVEGAFAIEKGGYAIDLDLPIKPSFGETLMATADLLFGTATRV